MLISAETCPSRAWSSPVSVDAFGVGYGQQFNNGNDMVEPPDMVIDCASPTFCVAVDAGGNAVTYDGSGWSPPAPIDLDGGGLNGVSCPTVSFCMAVDDAGSALSYAPVGAKGS